MHEEGKMDCNEIAREEAMANPKMEFIWNTLPAEFRGDEEHLRSVALKNLKTNEILDIPVDTCFLFIGYVPNTEIFKGIINMTRAGYVLTNEKMETNIPGVFAAGDVRDKFLKQVATAVGDGAHCRIRSRKISGRKRSLRKSNHGRLRSRCCLYLECS